MKRDREIWTGKATVKITGISQHDLELLLRDLGGRGFDSVKATLVESRTVDYDDSPTYHPDSLEEFDGWEHIGSPW